MKARCAFLQVVTVLTMGVCLSSQAASVTFGWTENSEPDLAGYKLYYGPASGNYTNHILLGKVSSYSMSNLLSGVTYYFALTAFNTNDLESDFSTELHYPNAPVLGVIPNQTVAEDTVATVPLHVTDVDSPISNLTLSATSSNPTLVPANNISFSGTGTNRTLQITPAANATGTAAITVTANDGTLNSTGRSFVLTVTGAADPPSISAIADVSTDEDVEPGLISFSVSDPESPTTNLTVRAASSNPALIPTNRIVLAGTNGARTVRLRPATNQHGSATITLTVSDGALSASTSFNFIVRSINDTPTITQITDRNLLEDKKTQAIPFVVSDVETASANLQVTASTSDPSVVPQEGLILGITSTNRTVIVCPATNVVSSAVITLTVSDGEAATAMSFTITYLAVNDAPCVSTPPNLTVNKLNPVPPIPFTVWDVDSALSAIRITLTSSNANLLPTNNMVVSGTGTNRTLTLSPIANQIGTSRVGIRVTDGVSNAAPVFFQFTVTGSNNAPVLTVPGPLAGDPATAIPVPGIRVADLDVGTNNLNLTLSVPNGTLAVSTSVAGGITASQVSGNNSGAVTILARLAALNATFADANGLTYTSRPDFSGTESLVVTVSDRGFSGAGGAQSDTETITIRLTEPSSLDVWRAGYFTAADLQDPAKEATVWGDLADPDNDGRHNLMEFALGLNPLGSEPQEFALISQTINAGGNQYLTLTFNSRINEPLLQYIPEVSADNAAWSATAQRTAATPINAEFEQVTYQDVVPITSETARFIRLRVVRNSP